MVYFLNLHFNNIYLTNKLWRKQNTLNFNKANKYRVLNKKFKKNLLFKIIQILFIKDPDLDL